MRVYVAYKLSGEEEDKVIKLLKKISQILEDLKINNFIFLRDIQKWKNKKLSPKEIMDIALKNMKECDLVLAILETSDKSEGMLIETGYAKALGKKIIVASKPNTKAIMLKAIADHVFEFNDLDDFKEKFKSTLFL